MKTPKALWLIFVLSSITGWLSSVGAEEDRRSSVSLGETEITESLRNIIGSFIFEEMEIVGSVDHPQFNFVLEWKDPIPFQDEETDVPRGLIDRYYGAMDQEDYEQRIHMTTGQ